VSRPARLWSTRRKRSIASSTAPRKGTSTTCSARKCLRRPPRTELPAPHCAAWQARQNHTVGIGNLRRQPKREGCELEPGHTLLPSKNKFWRLCPHQGQDRWAEPGTHGREEHPGVQRCTPGALPTPPANTHHEETIGVGRGGAGRGRGGAKGPSVLGVVLLQVLEHLPQHLQRLVRGGSSDTEPCHRL